MLGKLPANQRADQEARYPAAKRAAYRETPATVAALVEIPAELVSKPGTDPAQEEGAHESALPPVGRLDLAGDRVRRLAGKKVKVEGSARPLDVERGGRELAEWRPGNCLILGSSAVEQQRT